MKSLILFAAGAAAHFGLPFPEWRADTLGEDETLNQRIYPCANATPGAGPTTDWPLDGGALKLDLHHAWTYVFVNLGLGTDVSSFNISLTPEFWNSTGNGTLCVPKVPLPADLEVKDGDLASIQVVTVGDTGSALYNCADIKFSKDAKGPDECKSDNVTYYVVGEVQDKVESDGDVPEASGSNSDSSDSSDSSSEGGSGGTGAAIGKDVPVAVLSTVVGLALAFAAGMSL